MKDESRDRSLERALGSALRRSMRNGSEACPDSETLAAWSEKGLSSSARSEIDAHLATCRRCQAQVAALARSELPAARSPTREWSWISWRWLVPAAAGATALALWVAVQPDLLRTTREAPAPASAAKVEPQAASAEAQPPAQRASTPAERRDAEAPSARAVAPRAATPAEPRRQARAKARDKSARTLPREEKLADNAAAARPEAQIQAEGAAAPAPPQATRSAFEAAEAVASLEIVSSTPSARWRIQGTAVEHTRDGGVTWTKQPTGTNVPLTTGVSPSPDVCWIVGRRGLVLRSIDGRTWQQITFPEAVDLVQIRSTGPMQASVRTADARRFTTSDGGATWTRGGPQEF